MLNIEKLGASSRSYLQITRALRVWQILPLFLLLSLTSLSAAFVETFDNGSDDGDWHLTSDPSRLLVIEPEGGNPGPYLHGEVDGAIPTWYVPFGTWPTHFAGNFARKAVGSLSVDLDIFTGLQVPDRNVTLDLKTTFGTGDYSKGVDAYYIGADISHLPAGWHTYEFPLDAASPTIPAGWVVTRGDGTPGTDADWQALMQRVETLGVELGTPGYAYPFFFWDLGLDNVRLTRSYN